MGFKLDYAKTFPLDAEDLAEGGILQAYRSILNVLSRYVPEPAQIDEVLDNQKPSYLVGCGGQEHLIYSPELPEDEGQSWGRAAYAFFKIINDQLLQSDYRLYAINGGNDLTGIFLTQSECEAARRSLAHKEDWPYLPTLEHPWYGQFHA
jgi:hypothetical protein